MRELIAFIQDNKGLLALASGWAVREAHIWWPRIVSAWPYLQSNGGVVGIWKQFWVGKKQT